MGRLFGRIGCLIIGLLVIVAIGLTLGIGLPKWLGGIDLSSPIATVDSFYDALEAQDAGRVADCCYFEDPKDREDFIANAQDFFDEIESIDISNMEKEVTAETEDTARVEYSFHIKMVDKEGNVLVDEDTTDADDLVKHDGNWLIVP